MSERTIPPPPTPTPVPSTLPRSTRRPSLRACAGVALILAVSGIPAGLVAQATDAGPPLRAHRIPAGVSIDVDGALREDVWRDATPITDFTMVDPVEGATPTRETEIRVVYDADALYIGAKLYDHPDSILAFQKRRDVALSTDDRFMWIFDTFHDERTGYFFETNANGLIGDGIITGGTGRTTNKSWDTVWEVRTARLPDGWSVEVRMPFSSLNFDPSSDTWGINFQRTIRRRNEEIRWRGWRRNQSLTNPAFAGDLVGLTGVSQGVGLEVKPYVAQSWRNQPGDVEPTTWPGDVGVDIGYSITPGLRAAVSVNTDFAEVEVDQRRVNLTRFPLRFPEQRDFFLEGSGVYTFAPRSGPEPYFSRRIGLEGGQAIPLEYATRLGGQSGAFELGLLHVGTAETDDNPAEQFTVARVKRTLVGQSTIGAIWTRRATDAEAGQPSLDDRHTFGVDLDYRTTTFLGDRNFEVEAFLAWNTDPQAGLRPAGEPKPDFGTRSARGFRLNYPNDVWESHLSYREFGDDYTPAVGFVTRNDFRRVEPRLGWSPRPESIAWLRQLSFDVQFRNLTNLRTGVLEERSWELGVLGMEFESGDNVDVNVNRLYEFLDRDFTVGAEDIPILSGEYTNWEVETTLNTASRRRVSLRGTAARGGFWDGDRTRLSSALSFRPMPGYSFGLEVEHNQVELPRGAFDTNVFRFDGAWDISPLASVTGNVQYDDVSELVGLFLLGRWLVRPGSEIFLVYTHNWQRPGLELLDGNRFGDFETISRGASFKINYTWRW